MTVRVPVCCVLAIACVVSSIAAQNVSPGSVKQPSSYVTTKATPGGFTLASGGRSARIYVSGKDFPGVIRAANDLRADVERVTGTAPRVVTDSTPTGGQVMIVGTLGKSSIIDRLVREKKIDGAAIMGKWEAFVVQSVEKPLPGVDRALVIAGSDKRGTIYGVYDLSGEIGVSPWYWWADVPTAHQSELFVTAGVHTKGEPAVKYRGIFINDEAPAFSGWAYEKFGGVNHLVYEKMFELILRMKGNYLWPAMWGNAFAGDDSLSPKLADEYGIVMGTSHHEPMTRAQKEWTRYGKGPWDYGVNDTTLRAFWRLGIERMMNNGAPRENIVTIGMRGDGDRPMTTNGESNIALLEKIVADQRKIIADVTTQDPSKTPQLWALYKEVQDYYDKGMRVPDDVTLLFSDDNWGNVRRLPSAADRNRAGGFGIYYHFDYVGGPRNYKWINTNPIARVWEQMHLSYESGANRIWVVNTGDLKPMEFPIQFFLDYAWNPKAIPAERLPEYTRHWAAQQFSAAQAAEIANITTTYLKYAGRRKPELLDTITYSLTNYHEAERVVDDYNALLTRARAAGKALSAQYQDAYYELVLHPVEAAANLNDLYVTVAKNRLYALEGRASTNDLAARARRLFDHDAEISQYFNTTVAGGKWAHMMDQTHIGYTYWQEPPRNTMPRVDVIQVGKAADIGVSVVEQNRVPFVGRGGRGGAGGPRPGFVFGGRGEVSLPTFDTYQRQTFHVDVYNKGETSFTFSARAAEPWVTVSPSSGTVEKEQRVAVSIDWTRAPAGERKVPITFTGPNDFRSVIQAVVSNPAWPKRDSVVGFVEGNGYVSMEAEHYAKAIGSANGAISWLTIPDLGRTLSGVTAMPVTAAIQTPGGNAPHLEFPVFLFDSGAVKVNVLLSPTLNFSGAKEGLRYAVSFDDQAPQFMTVQTDTSTRGWEKLVADNISSTFTQHALARSGSHVLKFWMVDPGVVLQKIVIEARDIAPSYLGPPESYHRAATVGGAAATSDPRFDWFSYEGSDSIYKTLKADPATYTNPILAGFYPDPSITRTGDDYYLVNSSFVYFPGVPIFHSKDLVNWTQIGHVLDRPSQLKVDSLGISRGIFAPAISYHDGTFYMITTAADAGGNFIVTATNPAGPWSEPMWLKFDGIDPSLFFDDDNKIYIVNNGPPIEQPRYNGHRAIWLQQWDKASNTMVGPRQVIVNGGVDLAKNPIWIEAPHIFKVKDTYYLICAEGGTADQHSEVVFRSKSVFGPYEPYKGNPILTQRQLSESRPFPITTTGHADFVQTQNGEWWAVFLGARPYTLDTYNTGRETFMLPVEWRDGWPILLEGNATVPWLVKRPNLPRQAASNPPMSGNFVDRDDFTGKTLRHQWEMIRTPHEQWYDLVSTPGWLTIKSRPEKLGELGQPSFLGRRQQHLSASASVAMRYTPEKPGDEAGITAFQNDDHFFLIAVANDDGSPVVRLERSIIGGAKGATEVVASAPLAGTRDATTYLKIQARGPAYDFYYGRELGKWILLAKDVDGSILSTKKAGGFVGTLFGMYAHAGAARAGSQ